MTLDQLQKELQITLNHFVGLGNVIKESYPSLYPSEKGVMIYGLLVAGRRLEGLIKEAEKRQEECIINITGIDLVEVRSNLLGVVGYLDQSDCDISISMPRENNEPLFDSNDIVERENYTLLFPTKENNSEYIRARRLMIDDSQSHYQELSTIMTNVNNRIEHLLEDGKRIKHDKDLQVERLQKMKMQYAETQWKQDKVILVNRVKGELKDKDNQGKTALEIVQSLLNDIILSNTLGNSNKTLAYINNQRGDFDKLATTIVDKRDLLTLDILTEHFKFTRSEYFLNEYIKILQLREPCREYDGKLFVNQAALEFATMIKPAIKMKVDFSRKINIALFYAALRDFAIVQPEERNATLMAKFIHEVYEENVSADSIFKLIQKCLGKKFCSLDEKNHGNFSDKEFEKYKDVYKIIYSVIRGITLINIESCADYLKDYCKEVTLNSIYDGMEDSQIDKAYFAGLVLRGGDSLK